jgi:hypothetical protein
MADFLSGLGEAITGIGKWSVGNTASSLAAIGTLTGALSMAFIQTMKDLTPVRRWFQRWWLNGWIDTRASNFNNDVKGAKGKPALPPTDAGEASAQLIELATGGEEMAFFDLPADQLVAQMNAASQIALDYPSEAHYYTLLAVLSQGADLADIEALYQVPSARAALEDKSLPANYADVRSRVAHRLQRNLDGLQIAMSDRWQWLLQLGSQLICIAAIEIALLETSTNNLVANLIIGVPVALIAGYLAPVFRDLVAALQKLRA